VRVVETWGLMTGTHVGGRCHQAALLLMRVMWAVSDRSIAQPAMAMTSPTLRATTPSQQSCSSMHIHCFPQSCLRCVHTTYHKYHTNREQKESRASQGYERCCTERQKSNKCQTKWRKYLHRRGWRATQGEALPAGVLWQEIVLVSPAWS
jgi:hypothetical protein